MATATMARTSRPHPERRHPLTQSTWHLSVVMATLRYHVVRSEVARRVVRYRIESQPGTIAVVTIQIAVRLPDDIVAFVDEQVNSGAASSRAAVVARALQHERRRTAAERDAAIYAAISQPDDLDELATWAANRPMDID